MESKLKAQRTQTEAEPGDDHKDYKHESFPQYLYNAEGKSFLVQNEAELRKVDKAVWKDSPAAFPKAPSIDEVAKKAIEAGAQDK
jgi:isopentenyldiphosphate isomerase